MSLQEGKKHEVFICHPGEFKTNMALPLSKLFKVLGKSAFTDEQNLKPGDPGFRLIESALLNAEVVIVLIDQFYFVRSEYCMRELRLALDLCDRSNSQLRPLIFPVFLSLLSKLPSSEESIKSNVKLEEENVKKWKGDWTIKTVANVIRRVKGINGMRSFEDKTFQLEHVAISVQSFLETGQSLSIQDFQDDVHTRAVNELRNASGSKSTSVWRMVKKIRRCLPPTRDKHSIDLHHEIYVEIKAKLLRNHTNSSSTVISGKVIEGLGASGGSGKTWLAIRLAYDEEILSYFTDGVLWATFGEVVDATRILTDIWYDLGGKMEEFEATKAGSMYRQLAEERDFKLLIVLDDVWHTSHLQVFRDFVMRVNTKAEASEVRVLVTTRFKDKVQRVFSREECELVDLNAKLNKGDALNLMQVYAGEDERFDHDNERQSMIEIAGLFGYHPKALSIISTRVATYGYSWERLLDALKSSESKAGSAERRTAKENVFSSIEKTLDFVGSISDYETKDSLQEKLFRLGVFFENSSFSRADIKIAWSCPIIDTYSGIEELRRSSIIEQAHEPNHDLASVYFFHDLVRDFCREMNVNYVDYEREFLQNLVDIYKHEKSRVTEYLFKWFSRHKIEVKGKDEVSRNARHIYEAAEQGKFNEKWAGNEFIVLTAFQSDPYSIRNASPILCCQSRSFFVEVLGCYSELNLRDCPWSKNRDSMKQLARALERDKTVKDLRLDGEDCSIIATALKRNGCLTRFSLGQYSQGNYIGDIGAEAIAEALGKNVTLQELFLADNQINGIGAAAIGKACETNSTLLSLELSFNKIKDDGAAALSRALKKNSTLLTLDLRANEIGYNGAVSLGKALEVNSTLRTLRLALNEISNNGAVALAKALETNSSLLNLNLNSTQVADEGAEALGKSLQKNSTLQELSLNGGLVTQGLIAERGAVALGNALEKNIALQTLSLSSNKIGDQGAKALRRALIKNSTLQYLFLYNNEISGPLKKSFATEHRMLL